MSARVAIYTRVSSNQQEQDGTSLDTQLAACRAYAEQHGYSIAAEFTDTWTGSQYRERPGLSQLRELVRSRQVDVVIAHALDRISRSQVHTSVLVDEIEHYGARIELVTESFEDSAAGRLIRSVQSFVAETEREKLIERTTRGRSARARNGKILPGPKPRFGYRWDDDRSRLLPDASEAAIVKRIYQAVLSGQSLRKIAISLSEAGIPSPTGNPQWAPATLRLILRDPGYAGRGVALRWQTTATGRGKHRARALRGADSVVALSQDVVPALVDDETWQAVQQRLDWNKQHSTRNNSNPEATLLRTGFVRCGVCGRAMVAANNVNPPHGQYRCRRDEHVIGISAAKLDEVVWGRVSTILTKPEIVAAELERQRQDDSSGGDIESIDRSLNEVARKQRNLTRTLASIDDAELAAPLLTELKSLARRHRDLQTERDLALTAQQARDTALQQIQNVEAWCRQIAMNLDTLDYAGKRLALEALGVQVTVWPASHSPRYQITASIPLDHVDIVSNTPPAASSICCRVSRLRFAMRW